MEKGGWMDGLRRLGLMDCEGWVKWGGCDECGGWVKWGGWDECGGWVEW